MGQTRIKAYLYTFLIIFLISPNYISSAKADIIPIDYRGTAGFVPVENDHLILTNANVVFDINYRESANKIYLHIEANYTIYNPNESKYITLGAPFSSAFNNIKDSCLIKVNESSIPFNVIQQDIWDAPWDKYHDFYYQGQFNRKFIVVNLSIPGSNSLNIRYIFDSYISNPNFRSDYIYIYYDIGTSRAWNGPITEKVEFRVIGKQPKSYSDYNCTITNIVNGKSYVWEWKNEIININGVFISYSNYWIMVLTRLSPFIIFGSFIGVSIILILLYKRKQRKKNIHGCKIL
ncbi:MAG: hypothetical protein ACFE9Q_04245 [Candidatus Hodarchaeota archaeon]